MKLTTIIHGIGLALSAALLTSVAADKGGGKIPPASDKKGVTYTADIKPIFDKSCIGCHGKDKQKGKLRLDTYEGISKGGEDGKIFEAGKSADAMVVKAVARVVEDDAMPPADNKDKIPPLTPAQVGLIRAWIDQGGKK